jgi:transcriptional regulator of acetoin/glycerol metabolism
LFPINTKHTWNYSKDKTSSSLLNASIRKKVAWNIWLISNGNEGLGVLNAVIRERPAGSYNKKKASAVVALYNQKNSINFIEDNLNISRSTIYQYLRKEGVKVNGFTKGK